MTTWIIFGTGYNAWNDGRHDKHEMTTWTTYVRWTYVQRVLCMQRDMNSRPTFRPIHFGPTCFRPILT